MDPATLVAMLLLRYGELPFGTPAHNDNELHTERTAQRARRKNAGGHARRRPPGMGAQPLR